jgi:hypothetical protein
VQIGIETGIQLNIEQRASNRVKCRGEDRPHFTYNQSVPAGDRGIKRKSQTHDSLGGEEKRKQ